MDDPNWIFTTHNTLSLIRKLGSKEDLYKLRQTNQTLNADLNSHYFDVLDAYIGNSHFEEHWPTTVYSYPLERECFVSGIKNELTTYKSKIIRERIHLDKLSTQKHIFRTAVLNPFIITPNMIKLCTEMSPCITKLVLWNITVQNSDEDDWCLSKLINQFEMLRVLELNMLDRPSLLIPTPFKMGLDEVEIELDKIEIRSKPKIIFNVADHHENVLAKFGARANTTFKLSITEPSNDLTILDKFQDVANKFGNLRNIEFVCLANIGVIKNFHQLRMLATLWPKHWDIIGVDLHLKMELSPGNALQYETDIKQCLTNLSPFIAKLDLEEPEFQLNLLNVNCDFPKLVALTIGRCRQPLKILKKCPNLTYLKLEMDPDLCIFANKDQSYEENLKEYFGNLPRLTFFNFYNIPTGNVIKKNEFQRYLVGLLPSIRMYNIF